MSSAAEICSIGLVTIGEEPITSLTGTLKRQVVAKQLYAPTRKAFLTEIHWRVATHTQVLARQATEPVDNRYKYQFSLPTDPAHLKTLRVSPGGAYEIQGNLLLSNSLSEQMTYLGDVSEAIMPAYLVMALGLRMGMMMAIPLTKSPTKFDLAEKLYETYLPTAKFADASQQPNVEANASPFVDCRQ